MDPNAMNFDQDTQDRIKRALSAGADPRDVYTEAAKYQSTKTAPAPAQPQQPSDQGFVLNNLKSKASWLNLPTLGGAGGAAAGAALGTAILPGVGTVLGGIAGGLLGGGAGEAGRQKLNNEQTDTGEILKQGAYGAAGEIAGPILGKVAGKIAKPVIEGAGNILTKQAEEAALKGIAPSKTWLKNYLDKTGEDAAQTLLRHDLAGAGAQQIEDKAIKPLQESFDQIANKSGAVVDPNDLINGFAERVDALRKSPVKESQAMADHLEEAFGSITDKLDPNKPIDIGKMNQFRQEFDKVTKDFAKDPAIAGANRQIGSILRDVVQSTAEKAGLTGPDGQSLKELGSELNKLYQVHDLAALQDQVGRGKALGMMDMLAGGAGSAAGGVPGMIAGVAAKRFAENPKVVGFLSKMAENGGQKLLQTAEKGGQSAIGNDIAGAVIPRLALGGYSDNQASPAATSTDPMLNLGASGSDTSMPVTGMAAPSTSSGMSRDDLNTLIQKDMQYTGGRNIDKYKKMYEAMNPNPKLSDNAIGTVNDLGTAISSLSGLKQALTENADKTGPIAGRLSAINPYDTNAQTLQAQTKQVSQIIGKALEGGKLTDQDALKYEKILPTMKDTPAVAAAKINNVMMMLQGKLKDYSQLQNSRGSGTITTNLTQ